jgi:hypothetical protein
VSATCPQIAEGAHAHDGNDCQDEEFHDRSFLGPEAATVGDSHHPSAVGAIYTRTLKHAIFF